MDKMSAFFDSMPRGAQWSLALIGAVCVARAVLNVATFFLNSFILPGNKLRKYGKKGTWAVVTGASDGLGKEFATQLAAEGFNVVLVSRTQAKLEALAAELEQKHAGLQTRVLAMDFSHDDDDCHASYDRLASLVADLDVGILVNNVGQSHSMPVPFLETERAELNSIIRVNCLGTLRATQAVAPQMVRRHQADRNKRALILTLGSFSGWIPTPYLATYSGSKAFLQHWSSALASELAADGIDVQLAIGYLIVGAMSKVRRASLLIPNPRPWVRAALGKVGRTAGSNTRFAHTITPWWSHALFQWLVENTIGSGHAKAIDINLNMHKDIRARALKKAAREAKKA